MVNLPSLGLDMKTINSTRVFYYYYYYAADARAGRIVTPQA